TSRAAWRPLCPADKRRRSCATRGRGAGPAAPAAGGNLAAAVAARNVHASAGGSISMPERRDIQPSGRTILVVDDDVEALARVRILLEHEGHRVLVADSGAGALRLPDPERVQLMLIDHDLPVMNGEQLVRRVRERERLVAILLQTGSAGAMPPREMLRRLAIQGCHGKSDGPDRLLVWVDVALRHYDQL